MDRFLMKELEEWKTSRNRKPLLLQGARQVGKTWLALEFAGRYFDDYVYINFDKQRELHTLLETTIEPGRVINALETLYNKKITAENTLIIFDEVQEEPRALTALKYFQEEASEYAVIATGSYMGIALHNGTSFPVGKVDRKTLYPMSFREFLCAAGYKRLNELILSRDHMMITAMKEKYIELLKSYCIVGGMPEAVKLFLDENNYNLVREKQKELLDYYRYDFSKHADARLVARLNQVWEAIPSQLAKEKRKFVFGRVEKGARAKDFELAIEWLKDSGLIHVVRNVYKAGIPLKSYSEMNAFKLYLNDVGLMGAMGDLPVSSILDGVRLFEEFKGAMTEQYVLTQLVSDVQSEPYYYSADNSRCEIDFLIQKRSDLIPIEVKASENLKAKSLRVFVDKHPAMHGVRISMSDYREQDWMTNLPLYAFTSYLT